jgi:hypothetical protein
VVAVGVFKDGEEWVDQTTSNHHHRSLSIPPFPFYFFGRLLLLSSKCVCDTVCVCVCVTRAPTLPVMNIWHYVYNNTPAVVYTSGRSLLYIPVCCRVRLMGRTHKEMERIDRPRFLFYSVIRERENRFFYPQVVLIRENQNNR